MQNKSAAGRCPSGIAVSRKRGPSARICRQIDEPSVLPPSEGKIKTKNDKSFSVLMVPLVGVEPTRYRYHGILSPARLPIPPQRHFFQSVLNHFSRALFPHLSASFALRLIFLIVCAIICLRIQRLCIISHFTK